MESVERDGVPRRSKQRGDARAGSGSEASARAEGKTTPKKRPRLSPGDVTAAAILVADADGLDAVSIRRVAAELDVRPMSLYTHFSSKDELLSSMAEKGIEEMLVQEPLPDDWREAVALLARRMYGAFVAHPWHIQIFTQKLRFGPNATRLAKQAARAFGGLPVESSEVWLLQGTVNDFVLGHSLRAVTTPSSDDFEKEISKTDVVEFPELSSLGDSIKARVTPERFELGLEIVLDGIEQRILRDQPGSR